jgi:hypothetical protein
MSTEPSKQAQRTPLRVGVMVRGDSVPRWVARLFDRIDTCPFAEVVGFVRAAEMGPLPGGTLLYRLYSRLDGRRFAVVDDPPDEIDLAGRLARAPTLELRGDAGDELNDWDLDYRRDCRSRPTAEGDAQPSGTRCVTRSGANRLGQMRTSGSMRWRLGPSITASSTTRQPADRARWRQKVRVSSNGNSQRCRSLGGSSGKPYFPLLLRPRTVAHRFPMSN